MARHFNEAKGRERLVDEDVAWKAFAARDRSQDGRFVIAVRTTGVYCKPSCAARRPRRDNVEFFAGVEAARAAGYRACLRCRPDEEGRDREAVARAVELLKAAEEPLRLDELAASVGYAPHHFQRLFKREIGLSPAAYAREQRISRAQTALANGGSVIEAIYDAGYSGPGRFYESMKGRLGMTPAAWKKGGAGERIRFAVVDSALGAMLVAATEKGLCRISFDEGEADLRRRFPHAEILPGDTAFEALVTQVVALVADPAQAALADLPTDARGTAFQQAVWAALRAIPAGETRSYAQIAAEVGRPQAVRAAGSACGDNGLAVLIPCHRVLRSDGGLGGYAYGLERKEKLLKAEGAL